MATISLAMEKSKTYAEINFLFCRSKARFSVALEQEIF